MCCTTGTRVDGFKIGSDPTSGRIPPLQSVPTLEPVCVLLVDKEYGPIRLTFCMQGFVSLVDKEPPVCVCIAAPFCGGRS